MKKYFRGFIVPALIVPIVSFTSCEKTSWQQANSIFWKADKNGRTLFVLGTMHVPDKRFEKLPVQITTALDSCSVLLEEMKPDMEERLKISKGMELPPSENLRTLVGKELFERLVKVSSNFVPPIGERFLEGKKIWAAAMMISFPRNTDAPSLDMVIYDYAENRGIKTIGLETAEEQIAALDAFSQEEQLELLLDAVEEAEDQFKTVRLLTERYFEQDIAGMSEIFLEKESKFSPSLREKYLESMLYTRNRLFFEKALPYLEKENCFIAVGAGHLAGERGLLNILHKNGYRIKPIKIEFK